MQDTLDEHESMRSKGDAPRDFIDAYLDEMEEQSKKNSNSTFSSKPFSFTFFH
jgi:methyl farnesoate epoxidase/farnesoate epoxidase